MKIQSKKAILETLAAEGWDVSDAPSCNFAGAIFQGVGNRFHPNKSSENYPQGAFCVYKDKEPPLLVAWGKGKKKLPGRLKQVKRDFLLLTQHLDTFIRETQKIGIVFDPRSTKIGLVECESGDVAVLDLGSEA